MNKYQSIEIQEMASATRETKFLLSYNGCYYETGLLLFILASSFFHELGHASACKYFGLRHGGIGFGPTVKIVNTFKVNLLIISISVDSVDNFYALYISLLPSRVAKMVIFFVIPNYSFNRF